MRRTFVRHALRLLGTSGSLALLSGCWMLMGSHGGGQASFEAPRTVRPGDVAVPAGYRVEAVATGLTFPSGVAFDEQGHPYVLEAGYSYGEAWTTPRLLRVGPDGRTTVVAAGDDPPWTGLSFDHGAFYVSEGGEAAGGRIVRITPDGGISPIITGLPSLGDHHTNRPVVGPDGWVYFGQGTATNSGVVGPDNAKFGWLKRHPTFHDTPGRDVVLSGTSFRYPDPLKPSGGEPLTTGPYLPMGTPASPGQVVPGALPCNGAIMRVRPDGRDLELVAWGLRNPFGLAFAPDGRLYVTENGADQRGVRPIFGAPDCLWRIEPGHWYGWPDYIAGEPVTSERYKQPPGNPPLSFLLARHPETPPHPAAVLGVHASANGFDFSRDEAFGHVGDAFVAEFGDMAPDVGKVIGPVGFKVVRVDPATGVVDDFAINRGRENGPATRLGTGGLERPVDARFDPSGTALYVVDFGVMTMGPKGPRPQKATGVLWRISREASARP